MFPELGKLKNRVLYDASTDQYQLQELLERRDFTHAVQVIISDVMGVPIGLKDIAEPYYMLRQVPLADLLNFEFLAAFVQKGALSVITAYCPDKGNSMAITTKGVLTLNVDLDLSHKLGLESSNTNPFLRKREFNLDLKKVEINLMDPRFYPGTRRYDRVVECVTRCNLRYDILLHWKPPSSDFSPFSPVKFLIDRIENLEWKECNCRFSYQPVLSVDVPSEVDKSFFDWAGVVTAGGHIDIPGAPQRNFILAQWTGFIPKENFQKFVAEVRQTAPEIGFAQLSSVGFRSDPTLKTRANFNNESTLSVCFRNAGLDYVAYACPPL